MFKEVRTYCLAGKILMAAAFIYVAFFLFIDERRNYRLPAKSFESFDTSELCGRLGFISNSTNKAIYFNIDNDKNKYYEIYVNEINSSNPKVFRRNAHIGDSIVKHKYSDKIVLFTSTGVHYYYIDKGARK